MPRFLCTVALALLSASVSLAERVPLSPEQLGKEATHVVVGEVTRVFKTERTSNALGRGTIEDYFAVEIVIEKVEKNPTLAGGDVAWDKVAAQQLREDGTVYARCFSVKKAPIIPLPGPSGHSGRPAPGQRVRVYLQRDAKGGYDVVYPNGFEALPKK